MCNFILKSITCQVLSICLIFLDLDVDFFPSITVVTVVIYDVVVFSGFYHRTLPVAARCLWIRPRHIVTSWLNTAVETPEAQLEQQHTTAWHNHDIHTVYIIQQQQKPGLNLKKKNLNQAVLKCVCVCVSMSKYSSLKETLSIVHKEELQLVFTHVF